MDIQTIITAISIAGTLAAIVFGVMAILRANKNEHSSTGERQGTVLTELGYIKSGIDDIKRKQERTDEQVLSLITRVTAVEASSKQAHKRIDRIEGIEDRHE